jgi:ribonucleoside-triphosphate reductase
MKTPSFRAQVLTRRTYNRPLDETGEVFERWDQTVDRVIGHQRWLWERALGARLNADQELELDELRDLLMERKVLASGRTLWLGGTGVSRRREASMFNCSFVEIETVHDVVDGLWLLLQGCGVGFHPRPGVLNGFTHAIPKVTIERSSRTTKGGHEQNVEEWDAVNRVWTIRVGDSAEAWAKSIGKLLAGKYPARELVLDFRAIRPAGERLTGYGWISSGDDQIAKAYTAIANLLNERAGKLLTAIDILDVMNWLGTILSSRRSAEIALLSYGHCQWEEFARAKFKFWESGNPQRAQSNNSLLFWEKPSKMELRGLFDLMLEQGGSEPGFINADAALKRAPWFRGVNPCAEILLGAKSFCNLTETNLAAFNGDLLGLHRAHYLAGRMNYRQTCVDLRDGVLQSSWHELNQFLRLCGVGVTGIVQWEEAETPAAWEDLRYWAQKGANSMADELGLPRSKAITTVKPSGTLSKIMDTTEGVHKPMAKYIFNNVMFSKHDKLVPLLRAAGYRVMEHPLDDTGVLVTLPVAYENVEFDEVVVTRDGRDVVLQVNKESAVSQLNRYKLLMGNYVDHNCSITVSYDPSEIPAITEWLYNNWDHYVGVSWLLRNDPTKTAADLGYPYLPQEAVTQEAYEAYVRTLVEVDIDRANSFEEVQSEECSMGVCPVR